MNKTHAVPMETGYQFGSPKTLCGLPNLGFTDTSRMTNTEDLVMCLKCERSTQNIYWYRTVVKIRERR